jgi:hypothetical protein
MRNVALYNKNYCCISQPSRCDKIITDKVFQRGLLG